MSLNSRAQMDGLESGQARQLVSEKGVVVWLHNRTRYFCTFSYMPDWLWVRTGWERTRTYINKWRRMCLAAAAATAAGCGCWRLAWAWATRSGTQ